jgi:hypothetical protein
MSFAVRLRSLLMPEPALAVITLAVSLPIIGTLAYIFLDGLAYDPVGATRSIAPYFLGYYGMGAIIWIIGKIRGKPGAE